MIRRAATRTALILAAALFTGSMLYVGNVIGQTLAEIW